MSIVIHFLCWSLSQTLQQNSGYLQNAIYQGWKVYYVKSETKTKHLIPHRMENINIDTQFPNYFTTKHHSYQHSAKYSNIGISTKCQYLLFKRLIYFCSFSGEWQGSPAERKDNVVLQIAGRNCERTTLRSKQKLQDDCRRKN